MAASEHVVKRAFITGTSGFVGQALLRELGRRNVEMVGLFRKAAVAGLKPSQILLGDLSNTDNLARGMEGADTVFHCAAHVQLSGPWEDFQRGTVKGTQNIVLAAKRAGVRRLVHVSTEAVLADGRPFPYNPDETYPRPTNPIGPYTKSKGMAEEIIERASDSTLTANIVRPRFIWGTGSPLVTGLRQAAKAGMYAWIDGGDYLTSTCYVDNCIEGMMRAAEVGQPGEKYFLTDGAPIPFRFFVEQIANAEDINLGTRSAPMAVVWPWAASLEFLWQVLPAKWIKGREPPITRQMLALLGQTVVLDDSKARNELGYQGLITRQQGLKRMADAHFNKAS